jgi:DNA-binding PucR family transcriptional regulator
VENDGSTCTVGELLFYHPSTARYRLHRIERCTGWSLSKPKNLADLCLALAVHRCLM